MTIHAGILGSLPTDVTSVKLAAMSFTGGLALITVILLMNTIVDATTSALRPVTQRKSRNYGPLHDPGALWGSYAPRTRSVLPPLPWAGERAYSSAATSRTDGLRPLGTPLPLAHCVRQPSW